MLEGGEDPRFIAPYGHPRERGHRQRRPAGAPGRGRGRAGRRARRAAWSTRSTWPRSPSTWRWLRSRTPPTRAPARPLLGPGERPGDPARRAPVGGLPGREGTRPRRGLRLPTRPPRGRLAELMPQEAEGERFLSLRPLARSGIARALAGDPPQAPKIVLCGTFSCIEARIPIFTSGPQWRPA